MHSYFSHKLRISTSNSPIFGEQICCGSWRAFVNGQDLSFNISKARIIF